MITVPANVSVSTNTSQATVDIGIASATDNIDGIVAVTNNAPVTFSIGVTAVIYTASDSAGNMATATQQIYVSYSSVVGGGGGTPTPPPAGGGATVGMETVYWHHNDHLGTPQAMTDINGTKVWEMSQTPFGIATANNDPDGDGITVTNNFRFPGQYYDAETRLSYNYFRTYDSDIGAYPQSDPIGLNGGMNTFGYVGGNPLTNIDPFGLSATSFAGRLAALCASNPTACRLGAAAASTAICQAAGGCSAPIDNSKQCTNKPAIPDIGPENLCEQLALAEAKAGAGTVIMRNLADEPRLIAHYGPGPWVKKEHIHYCPDGRRLVIHYFTSFSSNKNVELKFVSYGSGVHGGG